MLNRYFSIMVILAALLSVTAGLSTPVQAKQQGEVPGQSLGLNSDSDLWRYVRTGNAGSTQMKN